MRLHGPSHGRAAKPPATFRRRSTFLALAFLLQAAFSSCGGEGIAAPAVVGAHEDTGCPSVDEALARTRAQLGIGGTEDVHAERADPLEELRPEITRILVDEGGLRVVLEGFTALVADIDAVTLKRLLSGVHPGEGLGALTPHLVELLRYMDGSSPSSPEPHLEPLAAMHSILDKCEAAETLSTMRRLLALEVRDGPDGPALVPTGEGDEVWLTAVLEAARVALADPALRDLLERIELEDPDGTAGDPGSIRVGRDAFLLLARLLAANLSAPDFDPDFTRRTLEDVLLARVTEQATRDRLSALLDLALLVTNPAADVFPQVQSFMQCVSQADAEAALPGLLYDWLTIEELFIDEFLDDVSSATGTAAADDLRLATIDVLGALEARPAVANDVARVMAGFVDDRVAPMLVRAALALQGTGVLAEVTSLADAVAACHPEAR